MKRQFLPIKDYPTYNDAVDRYMMESAILNGGSDIFPSDKTIFWDKNNTLDQLYKIEGNEKGQYISGGKSSPSLKSQTENLLDQLDKEFEAYKKSRVMQGFESPTKMPEQMEVKFYQLRARMTILEAEGDELRKRISFFDNPKVTEDNDKVLMYGPLGAGKLKDDILISIDGQKVCQGKDGFMIIRDDRSPYDGMSVVHYRRLCSEWQQKKRFDSDQPYIRAMRKISRALLPSWPDYAKKYIE